MAISQDNLLLMTDSYKLSHYKQYPPKTTNVYSYFESRGGKFERTLFFGLQYFLKRYLEGIVVTEEKIEQAQAFANAHFMAAEGCFNIDGWKYILSQHGGKLPVEIKAVPEGTVVPTRNVLMTIENTDRECYWLTNYLETLLVQVWYPITVATQSMYMKKVISDYLRVTGQDAPDFKLHDFGYRGVSSHETAGIGGAAHLVNFQGTDTIAGALVAQDYYGADMAGFSIPASEHSTITAWGREGEVEAMRNMLEQYPTGLVACVSDSFDIYSACTEKWGGELKDQILQRDGVLVVRPDSGEPHRVVLKVLQLLGDAFGYTENEQGYKVLDPHVRVIQGDGIDFNSLNHILETMYVHGWSADNIAFGSGGGLLQKLNRDTCKFAFKCSSVEVDGVQRDVYKEPVTDPGKQSKRGRLRLALVNGAHGTVFQTYQQDTMYVGEYEKDVLTPVFRDGNIVTEWNFDAIRERADLERAFYAHDPITQFPRRETQNC